MVISTQIQLMNQDTSKNFGDREDLHVTDFVLNLRFLQLLCLDT